MFSDPLAVTYSGSAKSLPRVSSADVPGGSASRYRTADGEFEITITNSRIGELTETEILFTRVQPDPDGPFTGDYKVLPNSFGMRYIANNLRYNRSDITSLRAALLALVDTTFESRLLGGEV